MGYLLGIDLGTSSIKAEIMDEEGKCLTEESAGYQISVPSYGTAEQSPEMWWQACCKCIRGCLNRSDIKPSEIVGIGLSGQMHGMVALDKEGNVIRPAIIHCDTRSGMQVNQIQEAVGMDYVQNHLLNPIFPGFLLPSLCWMKDNESEYYEKTAQVLLPKDYIRYRLTGEYGTDYSDASGTLAFDVSEGHWSKRVIERMKLRDDLFPECHKSTEISGYTTQKAAIETGLKEGIPVVYGGGDQIMQNLGNGVIASRDTTVTIGTSGQIFIPTKFPIKNENLTTHTFCSVSDKDWFLMGAILSAGVCLKWFQECMGMDGYNFREADEQVKCVKPGSSGVLFLPYLNGERTPFMNADLNGMFIGLRLNTGKNEMMRAIMEGVTFALKKGIDTCADLGINSTRLVASGGGAKSKMWLQIQADIFDRPIYISNTTGATVGAALAAGIGCGIYKDVKQACERVAKYTQCIEPIPKNVSIYKEYYELFNQTTQNNLNLMEKISNLNRRRNDDVRTDGVS